MNLAVHRPATVKLLDGRVLTVGGETDDLYPVFNDPGTGRVPQTYEAATGLWTDTSMPPWSPDRCTGQFAVRLSSGKVLVGGGFGPPAPLPVAACEKSAYLYDPTVGVGGTWSTVAPMPGSVSFAGAVLLSDGRAFVTAGVGPYGNASVAYAYDPVHDAWATLAPAPDAGIEPLVLRLVDGRVLVSGGYIRTETLINGMLSETGATYLYDPTTNGWTAVGAYGGYGTAGLVMPDGRVVIAGADHLSWNGHQVHTMSSAAYVFNPTTLTWTQLASMLTPRGNFSLQRMSTGQLLASGGTTNTAEVYDWGNDRWFAAAPSGFTHSKGPSASLDNGTILVAGGTLSAASEIYTPGDVAPPSTTSPVASIRPGATLGSSTVPGRVTWTGADAVGTVTTYDLARSVDGAGFATIAGGLTSPAYNLSLTLGHTYRFETRAHDTNGQVGPWRPGLLFKPALSQQTSTAVAYHGTWYSVSSTSFSGGSAKYAKAAGAYATFTFSGPGVAFVTTRGPTRGSVKVYVDGLYVSTVSLYAATTTYRYIAFQRAWAVGGTHTLRVVLVGTSGHPRVDVDVFAVFR
jgi:hypothetical protein